MWIKPINNQNGISIGDVSIALGVLSVVLLLAIKLISVKIDKRPDLNNALLSTVELIRAQLGNTQACKLTFGDVNIKNRSESYQEIKNSKNVAEFAIKGKVTNNHIFHKIEIHHIDDEKTTAVMLLKLVFKDLGIYKKAGTYITFRNIVYGQLDSLGHIQSCRLGQNLII